MFKFKECLSIIFFQCLRRVSSILVLSTILQPPKKFTLISERILREVTKIMFVEDINTVKQTQRGSNTNLLNKLIPEKTFYEYLGQFFL